MSERYCGGFTLTEVLIYLALLSLLLIGTLSGAAILSENGKRIQFESLLQREMQYLLQAVTYRIQNAREISGPELYKSDSIISLDDYSLYVRSGQLIGEHGHILSSEVTVTKFEISRSKEPDGSEYVELILALSAGAGALRRNQEVIRKIFLYQAL